MTEKEEKAIERLKFINRQYDCNNYYSRYDLNCIETVVEALEQKDKEIDSWKKYSNEQEESIVEKNNKICDMEFKIENQQKELEQKDKEIQELKNEKEILSTLLKQAEQDIEFRKELLEWANADRVEKDKIIDLIYNTFYEFGCKFSGSFMKFLSKKGFNEDCEKCDYETCDCKQCIKRYFQKKASEENDI